MNPKNYLASFSIAALMSIPATTTQAAKAPMSVKSMQEKATHIIEGEVASVTSLVQKSQIETGVGVFRDRVFTISLSVTSFAKGGDGMAKKEVVIQAWRPETRLPPLPGLQGHVPIPKKGDKITVYVKQKKGTTYEPFLPNGILIQAK